MKDIVQELDERGIFLKNLVCVYVRERERKRERQEGYIKKQSVSENELLLTIFIICRRHRNRDGLFFVQNIILLFFPLQLNQVKSICNITSLVVIQPWLLGLLEHQLSHSEDCCASAGGGLNPAWDFCIWYHNGPAVNRWWIVICTYVS